MAGELDPIVGNWYAHLDKGQRFLVTAVDTVRNVVELQHFDGDVEEVELGDWGEMSLEPAEAPEDWTGPVDDVEPDDLGYSETDMSSAEWRQSLEDTHRSAKEEWEDAAPETERDEWAEGASTEEVWEESCIEDDVAGSAASSEEEEPGA